MSSSNNTISPHSDKHDDRNSRGSTAKDKVLPVGDPVNRKLLEENGFTGKTVTIIDSKENQEEGVKIELDVCKQSAKFSSIEKQLQDLRGKIAKEREERNVKLVEERTQVEQEFAKERKEQNRVEQELQELRGKLVKERNERTGVEEELRGQMESLRTDLMSKMSGLETTVVQKFISLQDNIKGSFHERKGGYRESKPLLQEGSPTLTPKKEKIFDEVENHVKMVDADIGNKIEGLKKSIDKIPANKKRRSDYEELP